jgi:uncharacterized protein YunC (DUF1805 family)
MAKAKRVHSTPRITASKIKPKKSAVSKVKKSGFDLVPTRKSRSKPATLRDYAKIDFKPWTRGPGMRKGELIPAPEVMANHGVTCRMAYAVMLMTRKDLIAMHGKLDHEKVDQMMGGFAETLEALKSIAHMVEAAYVRVVATASAAHLQNGIKGVDYKPARERAVL